MEDKVPPMYPWIKYLSEQFTWVYTKESSDWGYGLEAIREDFSL